MEELKVILREAFGESSDSEAEGELSERRHSTIGPARGSIFSGANRSWERISEINGLWICRDFLTSDQQNSLISAIQAGNPFLRSTKNGFITSYDLSRDHRAAAEGWFAEESHNQAMRFGDLPEWAVELSNSIREAILLTNSGNGNEAISVFPQDLLHREPLFDQLITNVYQPGEGICAHIDLMKFEDGIAIVSLESSCVMHFSRAESEKEVRSVDSELYGRSPSTKVPVLLTPGSMALMWGEARYLWKHEINRNQPLAVGFQEWQGRAITQQRRTSVTLRRLCLQD